MIKKILFALLCIGLAGCATEAGKKLKVLQPAIAAVDNSYDSCVSGINDSAAILPVIDTNVPENLLNNSYFTAQQVKSTSTYVTQEFSCFSNNIGKLEGIDENEMQILVVAYAEALTKMLDYLKWNRDSVTIGAFNRALSGMETERDKFSDEIVQETVSKLVKQDNAEREAFAQSMAGAVQAMQAGQQRNQTTLNPYSGVSQSNATTSNAGAICVSTGQQTVGEIKQCMYSCAYKTHIITMMKHDYCPINVRK